MPNGDVHFMHQNVSNRRVYIPAFFITENMQMPTKNRPDTML